MVLLLMCQSFIWVTIFLLFEPLKGKPQNFNHHFHHFNQINKFPAKLWVFMSSQGFIATHL